ncbi:glycosyltransferase family 39 protein [Patescibacteria group bacterium]|nr:glycosyltransferase family 39 protein [Patescibacteria group bacterium]
MIKNKSAVYLILLTILSAIFIFYKFTLIPKFLTFDEVEFTKLALSLDNKPYLPYSTLATGHATLYFYIILTSLKVFGVNTFALRLPSAVFGILSVIVFFLITKLSFKEKTFMPIILTVVFLTSRWFIDFSRFAFEPTLLLFLELVSIYFLISDQSLFLSGLFAGLAYNSYTPGRIFFLLPAGFLLIKMIRQSINKHIDKRLIKQFLLFIVPFLITIAPLTIYLNTHIDTRIDQLFFWRNHQMTLSQKISGTWQNISSLSLMFFVKGDMNGRHNYPGKPALNPVLAGLFLIGLVYCLINYKKKFNLLFIVYFFLSMAPSIPIYPWENPSMLRTFTVIPSIVYFIGQGVLLIVRSTQKFGKTKLVWSIITALIVISSFYEIRTYFKYQSKVFESAFEIKVPLKKAITQKNPYEKNL